MRKRVLGLVLSCGIMLAVPLWILYELGIFVSQWITKPGLEKSQSDSAG